MNVAGIGIDSVDVKRFREAVEQWGERFVKKIFTEKEIKYAQTKVDRYIHMAGKFAAKEAVKKALPDGAEIGLAWTEIEILNSDDGKPYASLNGHAAVLGERSGLEQVLVSISHTRKVAVSNAIAISS